MALASVTVRGTPENPILDFDIPQGEKGEPGGIVDPVTLAPGTDLNNVVTSGLYRIVSTNAALALNCPRDTMGGHLIVIRGASTVVTQIVYPLGAGTTPRGYFQRGLVTTWNGWQFVAAQRVDQTAGRVIYTWDDLNGREQLVYGDTGERDIAASLGNGTFTVLKIRRYNSTVTIACHTWVPPSNGAAMLTGQLPVGFRNVNTNFFAVRNAINASLSGANLGSSGSNINVDGAATTGQYSFTITYQTLDPWPTTLPGVASGSIPST